MFARRLFLAGIMLFLPCAVFAGESISNVVARIGTDVQWRLMPFPDNAGGNVIKKQHPQGSIYTGVGFGEYFGLELGYQAAVTTHRKTVFSDEEFIYFTDTQEAYIGLTDVITTKSSINGFYSGLLGFVPISDVYRLKLIASVGVARLKIRVESRQDQFEVRTPGFNSIPLQFSRRAWVPKLSIGLQHMISSDIGIRTMLNWEKTSRFSNMRGLFPDTQQFSDTKFASLKNSTTLGLGVFYSF